MERRQLIEAIRRAVSGFYAPEESRVVAYEVAERFCGFTRLQALSDPSAAAVYNPEELADVCSQLVSGRPLQYVTGFAEFCGLRLSVAEGVLIPRPETEELVAWIMEEHGNCGGLRVLDIGTGSGAIAIALARSMPDAFVEALDISEDALRIARANASDNNVQVRFTQADILGGAEALYSALGSVSYDLIVSNPPYIPASEYAAMRDNVRRYEPHAALFVPDDDPLVFYREIGERAYELLAGGGELFVEIHENFAEGVCALFAGAGLMDISCHRDLNDRPRMVRGMKGK